MRSLYRSLALLALISLACATSAPAAAPSNPATSDTPRPAAAETQPPTPAPAATATEVPTAPPVIAPAIVPLDGLLAFASIQTDGTHILIMNADGSGQTDLTASVGDFSRPAWAPDGNRLGVRIEISQGSGIGVMDVWQTNGQWAANPPQRLTSSFDDGPAWAPDGQKLLYITTETTGNWQAMTMNPDGSAIAPIPNIPPGATNPVWSPDGQWIAFDAYLSAADQMRDLFIIRPDGTGLTQLTHTREYHESAPAWSPDSQRLAFSANYSGSTDLYVINLDGSSLQQITRDPGNEFDAAWSPDGQRLAFVQDRLGDYEIYTVRLDGSELYRLTYNQNAERWPSWRPAGGLVDVSGCTASGAWLADVTIPQGAQIAGPGRFLKIWRVQNTGSCTWTPNGYSLRPISGDRLSGPDFAFVPGAIPPGAVVDLAIPLEAPNTPGIFSAQWGVFDPQGQEIPVSGSSTPSLSLSLEGVSPAAGLLPAPVYFLQNGQIWRLETDAITQRMITNEAEAVIQFSISAQTGWLAYRSGNQVLRANLEGQERALIAIVEGARGALAWSPDGSQLAYPNADGVHLYTLASGADRLLIANNLTEDASRKLYAPLRWSPDGSTLALEAAAYEWAELGFVDVASGQFQTSYTWPGMPVWNFDSQSLYVSSAIFFEMGGLEPGLYRVSAATGEGETLLTGGAVWWPFVRPDGLLQYFLESPRNDFGGSHRVRWFTSGADGVSGQTPIGEQTWLFEQFPEALPSPDGTATIARFEFSSLDYQQTLLLRSAGLPPLVLPSALQNMAWGR